MSITDLKGEVADKANGEEEIAPKTRGRGRPPGTGKKANSPGPSPLAPESEIPPEVVAQLLDSSLDKAVQIPCLHFGWPLLNEQEVGMMREGSKPLINKYLPSLLGQWAPELMFISMALMVYGQRYAQTRAQQRPKSADSRSHGDGKNVSGETITPEMSPLNSGGPIM